MKIAVTNINNNRKTWMLSVLLGTPLLTRAFVATSSSFSPITRRAFATLTSTSMVSTVDMTASSASTTLVDNPYLEQDDLPKFAKIEPEYLTPAVEGLLEKLEQDFEKLEMRLSQNENIEYEEVLPEVERIQFPLGYTWGVAGHLNGVKNGDKLREAYETNQPKVVQAMTKFSQSKPLYDALTAIEKQWQESKLDDSDFLMQQKRRAVENSLLGMKLGGVGLEGAEKERFNEIKMRLAALATTFSNNVLDTTKEFSLTIEDPAKMEGVPESAKGLWANAHTQYLKSQAKDGEDPVLEMDAEKGPWRITLDIPSYLPAMSHIKDRELREQIYKAYIQRSSEIHGDKNNVPLIYEILTLRQEMARMLGFKNYAGASSGLNSLAR
jgi:oligopeptidase A